MPEHRPGTPDRYYVLESFLWRDFASVDEWVEWTQAHHIARTATSTRDIFEQAIELQTALRSLEAANSGEPIDNSAATVLNELIDKLDLRPSIQRTGEVKLMASTGAGRQAPIGEVLVMALDAMSSGDWLRFKLCRDPGCRASFYDASRNGTKTWCSMEECGSRNKMRRLRERQEGA
jgi:predicted RNA-binding Zn ribbon-like protein